MDKEVITKELTRFNVTDTAIAQLRQDCMHLTIEKDGAEVIHKKRIIVKGLRVSCEKVRKSLKEEALEWGRIVDGEAKRIFALIQPIEDHLTDEENRFEEEKARIKAEEEAKRAAEIKVRVDRLYSLDCRFDGTIWLRNGEMVATQTEIISAPEEYFLSLCKTLQAAIDDEKAIKAAEAEQIAKIKAEQDRIAAEQEAERQRLAAEAKAIQDEKDRMAKAAKALEDAKLKEEQDKLRATEMEKAKAEAAEKARIETEARIKAEAEEKAKKELLAKQKAERKEARRPDKEKLLAYARSISDLPKPALKHEDAIAVLDTVVDSIGQVIVDMNKRLEEL